MSQGTRRKYDLEFKVVKKWAAHLHISDDITFNKNIFA